ncbi:uncharacterized protein DS421_4g107970 [Arachis hypogaea]|nr:uncharacterized protein DS421_4g107970 [Arachis hypogaea]
MILGLPTDGLPVTGMTLNSFKTLEAECLHQFEVAPKKSDRRGSCIKLTWLRDLKERLQLTDENSIHVYVKCHIMLLIGTILFGDKSGASMHWKFLPLLRDFASIGQYSWGSACIAHLYRALCRASRFDCKEIDGPLTLLLGWAWIRLPYLAPAPRESRSFSLANRWCNWERGDRVYRYLKLAHLRKALDDLQEGQFVWVSYAVDCVDTNIIPADIYMHLVVWSATVPLVSFECIEWHATDRFRRQFDFVQGVPHQERNLDKAHGEVLTGPKNLNWDTATTHLFWRMLRVIKLWMMTIKSMSYSHRHLHLHLHKNNLSPQANMYLKHSLPPSFLIHQQYWSTPQFELGDGASFSQLLGFMASDASQAQYVHQPDFMVGSQNSHRILMTLIEENAKTLEHETDEYLMDEPDDEDEEEDEDEDMDEDEESHSDAGETCTPDETGKGYNLRVDLPRHSTSRYTPSVFNKAAKKCKNLVKGVKWARRK